MRLSDYARDKVRETLAAMLDGGTVELITKAGNPLTDRQPLPTATAPSVLCAGLITFSVDRDGTAYSMRIYDAGGVFVAEEVITHPVGGLPVFKDMPAQVDILIALDL